MAHEIRKTRQRSPAPRTSLARPGHCGRERPDASRSSADCRPRLDRRAVAAVRHERRSRPPVLVPPGGQRPRRYSAIPWHRHDRIQADSKFRAGGLLRTAPPSPATRSRSNRLARSATAAKSGFCSRANRSVFARPTKSPLISASAMATMAGRPCVVRPRRSASFCSNTLHLVIPRVEKGRIVRAQGARLRGESYRRHQGQGRRRQASLGTLRQVARSDPGNDRSGRRQGCHTGGSAAVLPGMLHAGLRGDPDQPQRREGRDGPLEVAGRVPEGLRPFRPRAQAGRLDGLERVQRLHRLAAERSHVLEGRQQEVERQGSSKLFGQDSDRAIDSLVLALAV